MNQNLSEIYSSAYLSLGQPTDDILQRIELGNIFFRRLSYRLEGVRQSEQAISIIKSATFTMDANENTKDLTAEIDDFVIPMWAEYQGYQTLSNPVWYFLPTVHLSMLAKERDLGRYACSFYGENANQVTIETSLYGNESMTPFNQFRVFYSPTVTLPSSESATISLPDNLVNMVLYDTLVSAIPVMIANASKQLKNTPELKDQINAWTMLLASYERERAEFEIPYKKWLTESRGSHRPRRRNDVLASRNGGASFPMFIRTGGN